MSAAPAVLITVGIALFFCDRRISKRTHGERASENERGCQKDHRNQLNNFAHNKSQGFLHSLGAIANLQDGCESENELCWRNRKKHLKKTTTVIWDRFFFVAFLPRLYTGPAKIN
jgi:hypothetical protein